MARGKYVVIEGHDGTGKSTQVALLREKLAEQGIESVEMHEPGGIPFSDALRGIIKDGSLERDGTTNLLLFTAARHELWRQLAEPALEQGKWVIAARNWYSTLAYQGHGEGLDPELIKEVTKKFTAKKYMTPDFACILFLADEGERWRRIGNRGDLEKPDTFEVKQASFQEKVHDAYSTIATQQGLTKIDARQAPEKMAAELFEALSHQIHLLQTPH